MLVHVNNKDIASLFFSYLQIPPNFNKFCIVVAYVVEFLRNNTLGLSLVKHLHVRITGKGSFMQCFNQ